MGLAARLLGALAPCFLLVGMAEPASASDYRWKLPPGFQPPLVPADNPMSEAKVLLGRHLFYDRRLSVNNQAACATCHRPERAFTDGRPVARGATGELHRLSTPSLVNAAYAASLGWAEPTLRHLEAQVSVPLFNTDPIELGLAGQGEILLARLAAVPRYRQLFSGAFPGDPEPFTLERLAQALASFQRTMISGASAYDRLLYEGDREALSVGARRGMRLFFSDRLRCSQCHGGFTFSGPVQFEQAGKAVEIAPVFHNTGLYNLAGGAYPEGGEGLYRHTEAPKDMGRFRAPTLRNIALTAPYMHDGSAATLGEVLDHYAAGGRTVHEGPHRGVGADNPYKSPEVGGFRLTAEQREDLLDFLRTLTDEEVLQRPDLLDPWESPPAVP